MRRSARQEFLDKKDLNGGKHLDGQGVVLQWFGNEKKLALSNSSMQREGSQAPEGKPRNHSS